MSIKCTTLLFLFFFAILALVTSSYVNYPYERDALLQLRESMNSSLNLHAIWTGPPCYENQSRWTGISCENWHVTHLVLEGIELTGSLPAAFLQKLTFLSKLSFRNNSIYGPLPNLTDLVYLEFVFLSQNKLSGSIPEEYVQLPNLKKLQLQENDLEGKIPPFDQKSLTAFNVSYNHLSGLIPETRALEGFPVSSYDHNADLCGNILGIPCPNSPPAPFPSIPSKNKNKKTLKASSIALIAAAAALVPLLVILVFMCYYRKVLRGINQEGKGKGKGKGKMNWSSSTEDQERRVELEFVDKERPIFNLDDLLRASAEMLGKGKLGTTYKALMETGPAVTVKRVKDMISLSKKEFVQQMQLLGQMKHENLVQIISFYYSKQEKLVIHEFVPQGSLFELLHGNRGIGRIPLNWSTRLSIIKDIAKGLTFLHHSLPSHKVPHANLKSSNVLLTEQSGSQTQNYKSKLSDFGYLPLLPLRKSSEKLAIGKCPEFADMRNLTHKADVYCFGIILLEIITGKIPGEISGGFRGEEGSNVDDLSDWVQMVVNNDWSTDILDMEILSAKEGHEEMLKLTELALQCTNLAPENRPRMSQVLRKIEEIEETSRAPEAVQVNTES